MNFKIKTLWKEFASELTDVKEVQNKLKNPYYSELYEFLLHIEDLSCEIHEFYEQENYTEYVSISINRPFIYHLLLKGEVIYVGKSRRNTQRPFSHSDKEYDEIRYFFLNKSTRSEKSWNSRIRIAEQYHISKYKPSLNKASVINKDTFSWALKLFLFKSKI